MNNNLALWGLDWATRQTSCRRLSSGIGSVLVPWLVTQPALGAGIEGARIAHLGPAGSGSWAPTPFTASELRFGQAVSLV